MGGSKVILGQGSSRHAPAKPASAFATAFALVLIAAAAAVAAPAFGKPSDGKDVSKPHTDSKDVYRPWKPPGLSDITMTKVSDLEFGRLVMLGSSGGSVMLPANGLPRYDNFVSLAGSSPRQAVFEVRGPANRSIQIQLTFPVSGEYGRGGNARLDNLSVAADYSTGFQQEGSLIRLKLDSSGVNRIIVGGKLTLTGPYAGRTDVLFPLTATVVQ